MKGTAKSAYAAGLVLFLLICVVGYTGRGYYQGKQHSATLTWKASPSPVKGYNIYRSSNPGGPYGIDQRINPDVHTSTTYVDTHVVAGETYYYVVKAVSQTNQESIASNEVKAVIPSDKD